MNKRVGAVVLAGLLLLAVTGCGSRNDDVDSLSATYGLPSTRVDLESETWVLDRALSSLTRDDTEPVTLVVDPDGVSGTAPCNAYRGDIDVTNDAVDITNIAATKRACGPAVMQAENDYFRALEAIDTADTSDVDDNRLVLSNGDGVRLTYNAFDADERLDDRWHITNVSSGDALESVLTGTEPTIMFTSSGSVTLETGCNTASGDYTLETDGFTVEPLRQTQMACSEPAGIMQQEAFLTKALDSAARIEIAPDKITLLNEQGDIALVAVA